MADYCWSKSRIGVPGSVIGVKPEPGMCVGNTRQNFFALSSHSSSRITSYNVCYTKLLRYTANDASLASNNATVNINVNSTNTPPIAAGDIYFTNEDTQLEIAAPSYNFV